MADEETIFPEDADDDIIELYDPDDDLDFVDSGDNTPVPYGFTWVFDFNGEDLDFSKGNPAKVTGTDVVNEWISHTLNTEVFETPAFDGDIGTNIFKLVGQGLDNYIVGRVEAEILSAIEVHDRIVDVETQKIFALDTDVYGIFRYITDDGLDATTVVQVG